MRKIAAVECAQERLRANGGNVDGEQAATGQSAMERMDAVEEMRAVVELLKEWPEDYPAAAVEWLLL